MREFGTYEDMHFDFALAMRECKEMRRTGDDVVVCLGISKCCQQKQSTTYFLGAVLAALSTPLVRHFIAMWGQRAGWTIGIIKRHNV